MTVQKRELLLRRRIRAWLAVRARLLVTLGIAVLAFALVVIGIAQIYLPAGLIATGIALFAGLFFDPGKVRKLTWPR